MPHSTEHENPTPERAMRYNPSVEEVVKCNEDKYASDASLEKCQMPPTPRVASGRRSWGRLKTNAHSQKACLLFGTP